MEKRERIEWFNYWIEDANLEKKRILLIGDSVTRALRKKLNTFLNDNYAVDLIAMSYSVLDKMHLEEIKHFFEVTDYKWDYIMFQFGRHGSNVKIIDSSENEKEYTDKIREILLFLKKQSPNLIALPLTMENPKKQRFPEVNRELSRRNEVMRKLGEEDLKIGYFELNSNIDYKRIEYVDHVHFSEDSDEYIARIIIANLFPDIILVEANRIFLIDEFKSWLYQNKNKKIYIYGNSTRRKLLQSFLKEQQISIEGVIVSEEYIDEHTLLLKEVEKMDSVIIVTPYIAKIWQKLYEGGYTYITLGTKIYEQIKKD